MSAAPRAAAPTTQRPVDSVCIHCETVLHRRDAACAECGGTRPPSGWRRLSAVGDDWLGQTLFEKLLLTRQIGKGSTARVYRAQSLTFSRRFALKIIDLDRAGGTPEENLATARRETDIASRLSNPHIVRIYEMRTLDDRYVSILMDYIDGEDLRTLVDREGPLEPSRAIDLVRQVAHGLQEAHQAGIVHRDIKPENLLLQLLPSGEDFIFISDFGIASPASSDEDDNGFMGTPLWASPEQIMGERVDARSDLYSIGALLYYLLTGQPPFSQGDYLTILRAHLRTQAPRLGDAGTRLFSMELEDLVASLLHKKRRDRPEHLLELLSMLDDLERSPGWDDFLALEGTPVGLMEDSETIETFGESPHPRPSRLSEL